MELVKYEAARRALEEACAVDEVKDIRDKAMAMRLYAQQAKDKDLEANACEIRLRAERRLGQMMEAQPKANGAREPGTSRGTTRDIEKPASLADAGIDKNLANRARKFAAIDDEDFEGLIEDTRDSVKRGIERTVVKALDIAATRADYETRKERGATAKDLTKLAASGKKFSVIYADPPWTFEVYSGKGKQRSAERHYDTMSLDDIKALPIAKLAADDCALFLWSVWPELPGALDVIEAWGFEYKTCGLLWAKSNRGGEGFFTGMGYWTRANSEPCLFATKRHSTAHANGRSPNNTCARR